MKWITIIILIGIIAYTVGFVISLWREKQKLGALGVLVLVIAIIVLPFFSVL
ncbi:hypothetical protein [Neobacillus mesonae]|uniref:hypothetical protein n=1 Tax=Neobacillus mesonae TaxID=1193713 RepID=UPI0020410B37|nr:hypothetical protein [Neobacillus mesonae]MCM3570972.1 hypothetical protein [Neobacillus mesonae]